jgi:chemotaxis receptor (MCP) glutamine deamidase CheD
MIETSIFPMQCVFVSSGLLKIDNIAVGVGVIIFSPASKVAVGMHLLRAVPTGAKVLNPTYYASTAIPYAVEEIKKRGMTPPFSVAIAGGGAMMPTDKGDVGAKMTAVVKDGLEKSGFKVKLEKMGGTRIRIMVLNIDEGKIKISHK